MNLRTCGALALGMTLLFAVSCSQAPRPSSDTRAADAKSIQDGEAAWNHDWSSKNLDDIVSHYADDAALMIPGAPIMKGRDSIRAGLQQFLQDKNLSLSFTAATTDVAKGGDIAYTQGTYTLTQTEPKTKKPITETGKYVTVYKKQSDGSWKAVEDISNADAPTSPPQEIRQTHAKRGKATRRRSK